MVSTCKYAYVTLATNDVYCKGVLGLGQSLKEVSAKYDLVVMVSPEVSTSVRALLRNVFDHIVDVDVLDSKDAAHLAMLKRPELGVTFTKIHCWKLTQYEKCVFMDADMMVLSNIDELFERDEFSAVADVGWPDMFNSGLFVYKPSYETFLALIQLAEEQGSFDGGDQGLLNTYYCNWANEDIKKRLSFVYNMQATSFYTYNPAFARFADDIKVVHFIGSTKPWDVDSSITEQNLSGHTEFRAKWHALYQRAICTESESLSQDMTALSFSSASEDRFSSASEDRLQNWQHSHIDYKDTDSFANIQAKIDAALAEDK